MDLFETYHSDPDLDPITQHWRAASGRSLYHDFKDGMGPVLAHRHLNPKGHGGLGGWVADTARVDPTAYIDAEAEVFGSARIGPQVWMQRDSKASGYAQISGPVALGPHVHFGGYAQLRIRRSVKHPIFIGYSPMLTAKTLSMRDVAEKGLNARFEKPDPLPVLMAERHHPIVNRWREEGRINTMIMMDDAVIFDTVRRGHKPIDDFNDGRDNMFSPHALPTKSWQEMAHSEIVVAESINKRGFPPELLRHLEFWPQREDLLRRVGGMPNTVAHAKLYMKH